MAVKMRLTRIGAKKAPFYRVIVADSRSPRDGRFIDTIGTYNPLTTPVEIKIDAEKAKKWLGNGAQPTEMVGKLFKLAGMANLQETLLDIAKAIVDNPDEVKVATEEDERSITLTLTVAADDTGMVIGRHGRIAKAIRTVIKAASAGSGKKVNVEIR